ncbi:MULTISPECIES: dihydrofolate reductase family protein [Staphylococcus]|uniref:dihydrofolate reductase family protein n=1 Tax=Staphylococcus TaxID=1279 RepID=UPI00024634E6|nr:MULTISPECIES: dihydrofolate reductase family protein [Staphylococcus]QAV30892.1 5-amino-6-(5-phosphoribosylamino)uracil reductase [Sulfitobacter donghicola]KAB7644601.1 5-amino-6-(5-phosphoribosylamino)uracil reductase [Staphylococcus sp. B2-b]MBN6854058.1 dihydrofolate reductase family protein [Staphylococcus warneri]MBT2769874.1 dihydrofolate reductase family protein [Staphylococcus warneri]MBX7839930.1 dihydrofolate reductase family protein [Staphylococcus warneri]
MARPKVIVHMSVSINGNITGPYGSVIEGDALSKAYEEKHESFASNAMLLGRKTIEEAFATEAMPQLPSNPKQYSREEDFIAETPYDNFLISLDPTGKAAWTTNHTTFRDRPEMHVIEVVSKNVSDAYLEHLRNINVSYIFGGEDRKLDLSVVLDKLHDYFGLETVILSGGGNVNWSFFEQGLIDEVSIVMVPAVDNHYGRPQLFDNSNSLAEIKPQGFKISHIEQLKGDIVWIHYTK